MITMPAYLILSVLSKQVRQILDNDIILSDVYRVFNDKNVYSEFMPDLEDFQDSCKRVAKETKMDFKLMYDEAGISENCIYVSNSAGENIHFLGDYGIDEQIIKRVSRKEPLKIISFDKLEVACNENLRVGSIICNAHSNWSAKVTDVFYPDDYKAVIEIDQELPKSYDKIIADGYFIRLQDDIISAEYHAATEKTSVSITLNTLGNVQKHLIIRTLINYALKRSRLELEHNAFQNISMNYSHARAMTLHGTKDIKFETEFTINAEINQEWIHKLYQNKKGVKIEFVAYNTTHYDIDGDNNPDINESIIEQDL